MKQKNGYIYRVMENFYFKLHGAKQHVFGIPGVDEKYSNYCESSLWSRTPLKFS